VRRDWLVLATGAQPQATLARGPVRAARAERHRLARLRPQSGDDAAHHQPRGGLAQARSPGYGWIFPCGDDVFNIGVGVAHDGSRGSRPGAPADSTCARPSPRSSRSTRPARELVEGGEWQGRRRGAEGRAAALLARRARARAPGVLVCGEAAGSTYALTGEGIGKAMETALHAAEAILAHGADEAAVRADYRARIASLKPRFDLYAQAHRPVSHPWLVDLLVWSARRSPRRLERLAGVLEEDLPADGRHVAARASCAGCSTFDRSPGSQARRYWQPGCDRDVPAARNERQHADRRDVQLHGVRDPRRGAQGRLRHRLLRGQGGAPVRRHLQRARVAGRRDGAALSDQERNIVAHIRKATQGGSRSRTRIRSCASSGAATGCSRTTAT
jgi:hypothetical protein